MSSIYKKGRDGYYYYQAYFYNPSTKKKDKRVFHALGTKDFESAKLKQISYDKLYEKVYGSNLNKNQAPFYFTKIGLAIPILSILIIMIYKIFTNSGIEKQIVYHNQSDNNAQNTNIEVFENVLQSENYSNAIDSADTFKSKTAIEVEAYNVEKMNTSIPKYDIIRVEKISGNFNQGKIFAIVDKNSSDREQRVLCDKIFKNYEHFSSIIICLYADTPYGISLASGAEEFSELKDQKEIWLAMYTFNSVEGEYFDPNPSQYLGYN